MGSAQCVHNTTYFIVRDGINTGYRIISYPVLYRILPYFTVFIGDPGKKYGIIPYPVLIRDTVFYRHVNTLVRSRHPTPVCHAGPIHSGNHLAIMMVCRSHADHDNDDGDTMMMIMIN